MLKAKRSSIAQVNSRFEQNPHNILETKSKNLLRILIPCNFKGTELQTAFDQKEHRKAALVSPYRKQHNDHLLSKLSPYFRNCVSHDLLRAKLSSQDKLPSLCYSCNKALDGRHEKTISFNRIKLKRRTFPVITGDEDHKEDMREQLTTSSPWKNNNREYQQTYKNATSFTPSQRFKKAQSFVEFNEPIYTRSPSFILPDVIKITPQKKTTTRQKNKKVYDVGIAPPPTPNVRYIRDLSPEVRNLCVLAMASMT